MAIGGALDEVIPIDTVDLAGLCSKYWFALALAPGDGTAVEVPTAPRQQAAWALLAYRFNRSFDLRTLVVNLIVAVTRCEPPFEQVIR